MIVEENVRKRKKEKEKKRRKRKEERKEEERKTIISDNSKCISHQIYFKPEKNNVNYFNYPVKTHQNEKS